MLTGLGVVANELVHVGPQRILWHLHALHAEPLGHAAQRNEALLRAAVGRVEAGGAAARRLQRAVNAPLDGRPTAPVRRRAARVKALKRLLVERVQLQLRGEEEQRGIEHVHQVVVGVLGLNGLVAARAVQQQYRARGLEQLHARAKLHLVGRRARRRRHQLARLHALVHKGPHLLHHGKRAAVQHVPGVRYVVHGEDIVGERGALVGEGGPEPELRAAARRRARVRRGATQPRASLSRLTESCVGM